MTAATRLYGKPKQSSFCTSILGNLAAGSCQILTNPSLGTINHTLIILSNTRDLALQEKISGYYLVLDPALMLAIDVFPCEDGHAQERSLIDEVLWTVTEEDLWIADRNLCTRKFLFGIARRDAHFIIRHHQLLPFEALEPMRKVGRTDTGWVYEQPIRVPDGEDQELLLRRIQIKLDEPTCEGDEEIFILTNLSKQAADAKIIASLYRNRWTIEGAFQDLAENLCSEVNTLGYPKAALFGFCVALVAYNVLGVVKAALRRVHGAEKIEQEVSGYYLALEISGTYQGMMIAIPEENWDIFCELTIPQLAKLMIQLAGNVRLSAFKKHPRGPKKKPPKRNKDKKQPHVSTAKLLGQR